MKTKFFIILLGSLFAKVYAQSDTYTTNIKTALDLYNKKEYLSSAKAYSFAIASNGGRATQSDKYNAACSWALAGDADSAFYYLFAAAEKNNYDNLAHITTDEDLNSIHSDRRWNDVLEKVKQNKAKTEANYIKPVVAILDSVYVDDQKTRKGIMELIKKEGMESPAVKARLAEMKYLDSVNLVKVEKILDEYGWLGFDKVGRMGALTIFLVIQHSPLAVQQKYLPMMREAVKNKQALAGNLALLEDRVALGEGRKQIYGSQLQTDPVTNKNFLSPLEDPDNVDKRRASVGLGPLADYLKSFDVEWDLEAFKKQQQEAELKKKNN